jgi:hypothetical protein
MFLNYIKELSLKRLLKKNLVSVSYNSNASSIKSIGLIIDETYFLEKDKLINEIVLQGISKDKIKVIVYRDKIKKDEVFSLPTFTSKHINSSGEFSEVVLNDFIKEPFDLLISYYYFDKPILKWLTFKSKSHFKVGFSSVDKELNHFMVDTNFENFKVFNSELFKYLKIFKKK